MWAISVSSRLYRACRNLSKVILVLLSWRNSGVAQSMNASPKRGDYGGEEEVSEGFVVAPCTAEGYFFWW